MINRRGIAATAGLESSSPGGVNTSPQQQSPSQSQLLLPPPPPLYPGASKQQRKSKRSSPVWLLMGLLLSVVLCLYMYFISTFFKVSLSQQQQQQEQQEEQTSIHQSQRREPQLSLQQRKIKQQHRQQIQQKLQQDGAHLNPANGVQQELEEEEQNEEEEEEEEDDEPRVIDHDDPAGAEEGDKDDDNINQELKRKQAEVEGNDHKKDADPKIDDEQDVPEDDDDANTEGKGKTQSKERHARNPPKQEEQKQEKEQTIDENVRKENNLIPNEYDRKDKIGDDDDPTVEKVEDKNNNINNFPKDEEKQIADDDDSIVNQQGQRQHQRHKQQQQQQQKQNDAMTSDTIVMIKNWDEHVQQTIQYQQEHGTGSIRQFITAYIEPWYLFNDTIPNTGSRGDFDNDKDRGVDPEFKVPLPLRTHTPNDLKEYVYKHAAQTCHDMPGQFPVDRGLELDVNGDPIVWNVGDDPTPPDYPWEEAKFCPVEADPFLPWIHDVFPDPSGKYITFIAQNRRRCRTGQKYTENVNRLIPQVTLLQSISVQRIDEDKAEQLAPQLWKPNSKNTVTAFSPHRYRLAPYDEADHDGKYTRFICQFHTTIYPSQQKVLLGETLSVYPFNYEMVSYRKGQRELLTPKGKDTMFFWTSTLQYQCPVPEHLQSVLKSGASILPHDGTPTIHLNVIPIRTSVRFGELYLTEDMIGPKEQWSLPAFDPIKRWGPANVLPRTEASGRWTNIPVCAAPQGPPIVSDDDKHLQQQAEKKRTLLQEKYNTTKPHYLSACLWASSAFRTRGVKRGADTATNERLAEWIEFHLMVGFDHVYIYDNSAAHTKDTNLQPVVDMFDKSQVTRIDWPSSICNNNIPAHDSTGERSTQYAAENSCRTRHAPFTEWITSFDTDEYFVPMGEYTNLKDVLANVAKGGTNILSLRSSRGRLRLDKSNEVGDSLEKTPNSLYLEAYNCDSAGSPKPSWAERARKQIYRSDYVLYHFVHYSTVTKGYLETYQNATDAGRGYVHRYREAPPSERASDEFNEAVMVHTKSLGLDKTSKWKERCRYDYGKKWQGCWAAVPWPANVTAEEKKLMLKKEKAPHNEKGLEYNCQINSNVDSVWVPKLREAMEKRKETLKLTS